jgi:hypothetical protein
MAEEAVPVVSFDDEHEAFAARYYQVSFLSFNYYLFTIKNKIQLNYYLFHIILIYHFYCIYSRVSQYVYHPSSETFFAHLDQHADTSEGDQTKKLPLVLVGNEGKLNI